MHHIEKQDRSGDTVITGTAEMPGTRSAQPWTRKLANADRYRDALRQQCEAAELHLAVTSGLQQLRFEGDLGEYMEDVAKSALGPFDAVWLIQGDSVQKLT